MGTRIRRVDIDWLRIYAILAVFVFHSSRFFDTDFWHVKNPTTYFEVQVWITFLANWLMPFVFAISGAALFYALGSRGALKFVDDKVRRLLVPLVVGVFTAGMLMVYLERITHYQFSGSFFDFIPHYFDGWYDGRGGNFAWMGLHLWYLLILFIYSVLFYPLFRWLIGSGRTILKRLGDFLAVPGAMYLLALPIAYLMVTLDPRTDLGQRNFGGWPLPNYVLFFVYGFILISHEGLQKRIQQLRWISLAGTLVCFVALMALWASQGDPAYGSARYAQVFGVFGISSWCWILTFFGFGFRHLTQSKPILAYANEAVLPFYILHQTVLLSIGYFVVQWRVPDVLKWLMISVSSFATIMLLYEFLVRRFNVMRFLFGMKPLPRAIVPTIVTEQSQIG
jgi:surface polysaccharide O-acyltransferase-like enzyme